MELFSFLPSPAMSSFIPIFIFLVLPGLFSFIYLLSSLRNRNRKNGHQLPPGPRAWPILGNIHMLGSLPHRTLHRLSKKYGPIMHIRLGLVPTIVVSTSKAAELFLKTHDVVFAGRPKAQASEFMSYGTKGMGFTSYGPYWRNIRKVVTIQLLSKSKIDSCRPMRSGEIGRVVKLLKASAEDRAVVDLSDEVGLLIEEMVFKMVIGMRSDDNYSFKPVIQEAIMMAGTFNLADFIPFMGVLDLQGLSRGMKALSKIFDGMLEKIIDDHAKETNNVDGKEYHKDFVHVMLSLVESTDVEFDRDNVKAVILDVLAGAIETSITAIEWTLTELLRRPQVMKKLQQELTSVIGLDRLVEETDLANLEYLDMVVKETMRLHPVAPLLLPRECTEDMVIEGYHVPKKSRLIVNAWAIMRDPHVWSDDADDFVPERFSNGRHMDVRGTDLEYIPFGSGRRGCPGRELGWTTLRFVVAQFMHCFDWELPNGMGPGDLDMEEKFGLTVRKATPLLAVPTYRLHINN